MAIVGGFNRTALDEGGGEGRGQKRIEREHVRRGGCLLVGGGWAGFIGAGAGERQPRIESLLKKIEEGLSGVALPKEGVSSLSGYICCSRDEDWNQTKSQFRHPVTSCCVHQDVSSNKNDS